MPGSKRVCGLPHLAGAVRRRSSGVGRRGDAWARMVLTLAPVAAPKTCFPDGQPRLSCQRFARDPACVRLDGGGAALVRRRFQLSDADDADDNAGDGRARYCDDRCAVRAPDLGVPGVLRARLSLWRIFRGSFQPPARGARQRPHVVGDHAAHDPGPNRGAVRRHARAAGPQPRVLYSRRGVHHRRSAQGPDAGLRGRAPYVRPGRRLDDWRTRRLAGGTARLALRLHGHRTAKPPLRRRARVFPAGAPARISDG